MRNFFKGFPRLLCSALLLCSSAVSASVVTFSYFYTFSSGRVVAGSFDGVVNGNLITDLSNISASLDGVAFAGSGHLSASSVGTNGISSGGATASFDGTQNNFMFIDGDYHQAWSNYFIASPIYEQNLDPIHTDAAEIVSMVTFQSDHDFPNYSPSRWILATTVPVPEPGTLALLVIGLFGVGYLRSRLQ